MADREREDEGCKRAAPNQPEIQFVTAIERARRRGDGVGALHELLADLHPDRHVLAGFERGRYAVRLDPNAGERVGIVDACREGGVVGGIVGQDAERGGGRFRLCHGASSWFVRR